MSETARVPQIYLFDTLNPMVLIVKKVVWRGAVWTPSCRLHTYGDVPGLLNTQMCRIRVQNEYHNDMPEHGGQTWVVMGLHGLHHVCKVCTCLAPCRMGRF